MSYMSDRARKPGVTSPLAIVMAAALTLLLIQPALAADPSVSKRVLADVGDMGVIVVTVTAADRAVYGITINDASGSIDDINVPDGWAGVASNDKIVFRTVDKPISAGKSASFRIVTGNAQASLTVTFHDAKSVFGDRASF